MAKKKPKLSKEQKQFLKSMQSQLEVLEKFVAEKIKWEGEANFKDEMFDGSPNGSHALFCVSAASANELMERYGTYDCFDQCYVFGPKTLVGVELSSIQCAEAFMSHNRVMHGIVIDLTTGEIVREESRSSGPGDIEPESWNNWITKSLFTSEA